MGTDPAQVELILVIAEFIGGIAIAFVVLKVNAGVAEVLARQSQVKADLKEQMTSDRETLREQIGRTASDLAVHAGRDEEKFKFIGDTLARIEKGVNGHTK